MVHAMPDMVTDHRQDASAYVCVHDIAASWADCRTLTADLASRACGLLFLAAGPTDEGVRIISVWRTSDEGRRFHDVDLDGAIVGLEPAATLSMRVLGAAVLRWPPS